jgi:hypothetical protein
MPAGDVSAEAKYPLVRELAHWKYARTHQEVVHRLDRRVVVSMTIGWAAMAAHLLVSIGLSKRCLLRVGSCAALAPFKFSC